jgi:type IV secretion system protein VirB9
VTRVIRARLGEEVVEIVNKNYKVPEFNETGTSVHGAVRIDKVGGVSNVE